MNPFAAIAVKTIGAGTAAALISLGIAGGLAQAASPNPTPSSSAAAPAKSDPHKDRRAIRLAVVESEADVLHITPAQLHEDLKKGQKVLIRYMNEGLQIHPMHLHGLAQEVVALDGHLLAHPYVQHTVMLAPGQRDHAGPGRQGPGSDLEGPHLVLEWHPPQSLDDARQVTASSPPRERTLAAARVLFAFVPT